MSFVYAFLVGGIICAVAQFIMDKFKIMPIYVTCLFVAVGGVLNFFGIYDKLIEIGGSGATLPISSFGHTVVHGVVEEVNTKGLIGLFTGIFNNVSTGITISIVMAFIVGLIFKPKG